MNVFMQKIYTAIRVTTWKNGGIINISALGSSTERNVVNQMIRKQYLDEQAKVGVVYYSEYYLSVDDGLCAVIETNSTTEEDEHILINYKTVVNYLNSRNDIASLSKEPITIPRNLTLSSSIEEIASSFDKYNATRIYNVLHHRMGYTDVFDILVAIEKGQIKRDTKLNHIGPLFVNALIKIVNDVYYRVSEAEYEHQCKERLESRKHH